MAGAKKVLLAPTNLKGHFGLVAGIGEWLLRTQPELEVHMVLMPQVRDLCPEGARLHLLDVTKELEEELEEIFKYLASNAKSLHESVGMMFSRADMEKILPLQVAFLRMVQELKPHVVVCDIAYNITNHLHAICKASGTGLLAVVCPSRPDRNLQVATLLPLLRHHFGAIWGAIKTLRKATARITAEVGVKPLSDSQQPLQLFPGSRALVSGKIAKHQLFVGPFVPLPPLRDDGAGVSVAVAPPLPEDLDAWLSSGGGRPVLYVAFGTVVKPSEEQVRRFVEAMDVDRWRVLWSLPGELHGHLPPSLAADRWRVDTFFPQAALLQSGKVNCFLSHCGANGTHECLSCGVPMVCMPFYCDQYEWAASICKDLGAGVQVDKFTSSADDIRKSITQVLDTPEYKRRALRAAERMREHAQAVSASLNITVADEEKAGIPVAGALVLKLLGGDKWGDILPALKKSTESFAAKPPSKGSCCRAGGGK